MVNSGGIVGTGAGVAQLCTAVINTYKKEVKEWHSRPQCMMWSDQVLLNYVYLTSDEVNGTKIKVSTKLGLVCCINTSIAFNNNNMGCCQLMRVHSWNLCFRPVALTLQVASPKPIFGHGDM
jgi:hypothetical protein